MSDALVIKKSNYRYKYVSQPKSYQKEMKDTTGKLKCHKYTDYAMAKKNNGTQNTI